MANTTLYTERRFLGNPGPFKDKKEEKFEKSHLRAYLKGFEKFKHGFSKGSPIWHKVKQEVVVDDEKRKLLKANKKQKHGKKRSNLPR